MDFWYGLTVKEARKRRMHPLIPCLRIDGNDI